MVTYTLDAHSGVPLYEQLYQAIRALFPEERPSDEER